MGRKTINPITLIAIVILFFSVVTLSYADSVEWTIMKTLQLKESAIGWKTDIRTFGSGENYYLFINLQS